MRNKYQQESQGPENIEARAVEPIYTRVGLLQVDGGGGGCRHLLTPAGTPGQEAGTIKGARQNLLSGATMMHVQYLHTERTARI